MEANETSLPRLRISRYLTGRGEWERFFRSRFKNLKKAKYQKAKAKFVNMKTLGNSPQARQRKLKQIKKQCAWLNGLAIVLACWGWLWPKPHTLILCLCILWPVIALSMVYRQKGIISIADIRTSPGPQLSYALVLPALVLMSRVLMDFDILEYTMAWIYAALLAPVFLLFIWGKPLQELKAESKIVTCLNYIFVTASFYFFTFFSVLAVNTSFDFSEAVEIKSTLAEKYTVEGESSFSYYFMLQPWHTVYEEIEVEVSHNRFLHSKEGATEVLYLKKGLLNIPWYHLRKQ